MALISKTIANLINGVSQQPPSIRNPTQCEAQENCLSDTVYGVTKRPPFQFVKKLWSSAGSLQPFVHTINRNPDSQYKLVITNGDLKVFGLDGVEKTVSFPDGKAYLVSSNNLADFQCLTLGDRTYILNRSITVTEAIVAGHNRPTQEALVFVKQGDYATAYTVSIGAERSDHTLSYPTVSVTKTTSDTLLADIKTTEIAADLKTGLDASAPVSGALEVEQSGSVLWIYPQTPTIGFEWYFWIAAEDSKGNNNLRLIRSQIQKFSDLPTVAPNGYVVQVVGDKASGFDDYYVKFTVDNDDDGNTPFAVGSWSETFAEGANRVPMASRMPLVLIDNEDGTFSCEREEWDSRTAGDATSNPRPSFIGHQIQYLFTFGNRLGLLCGDRVILSEVGVYTNFYLTTVTTFLDSDPIDIQPIQGAGNWLYAVPLAEKLILFSAKSQAVINGSGDLLTPKTTSLKTTTRYPVSSVCEPTVLGSNILFSSEAGTYSKVYEYFVQREVDTLEASEITSHVPKYLPKGVFRITGDDSTRTVVVCGSDRGLIDSFDRTWDFFVYKYFWINNQKVQSSWSRWSLPNSENTSWKVSDVHLLDGMLYLVVYDLTSQEVLLLKCNLDIAAVDSAGYTTHLDLRVSSAGLSSSASTGFRTYTLPYTIPVNVRGDLRVFRNEAGIGWGTEITGADVDATGTMVTIPEEDGIPLVVWFGFPYTSTFTFSEIHLKEEQNGVQVPMEEGKLSLRKLSILYNDSLYFRVEVTPQGRSTKTYVMTPYVLGDPTPIEDIGPRSGRISVPVNSLNTKVAISVVNDSVVGHRLQSAEWVGQYSILSQRV
jgi:hypothetical protein